MKLGVMRMKRRSSYMEIGWISQENLVCFRSLLLPDVVAALDKGEPVTALGLSEGKVKASLFHARQQIRKRYTEIHEYGL